ncbi:MULTISPECIES: MurR/RpiR family transcriptional regulator [Anaerotruncus]|jgi:RpiR family carbohydrate utilization transcriptional regulator|uniref:MurR/RpiR family transcriptional regulator n=1 Tax=Anaerotruncus TaxID=244127 RepID=UPI0008306D89|nr:MULTISPECIES: MurR/RpiR family transcriptional regulator [Anaerotruncus]RGX52810.1 MurR/RpiR family transcriptional regulator [Anaerotruncus sp. AF02-27]
MVEIENNANALLHLQTHYSTLRASEKRIADYILSRPDEIIYLSITSLANECHTSETSVIRLCKAMGYKGYQDFKINIAKSIIEPSKQIHEAVTNQDSTADIIKKVMSSNIKAIEDTMQVLSSQQVQLAIDAISKTRRLEFYGMGGSGSVALDAQHKFFKYGFSCIAYTDPHMQAMSAATMGPDDVAFGISHTGSSKDIVENLEIASKAGATTICITGGLKSPITKVSDIVLMVVSKEQSYKPEPMSSRIAQLAIIDVLSVGVALTRPDAVLNNLQKTRSALATKRF